MIKHDDRRLHVILESGILVAAQRDSAKRAGIFRVTETLVKGLAALQQVDLTLWMPGVWDSVAVDSPSVLNRYVAIEGLSNTVTVPTRLSHNLIRWAEARLNPRTIRFSQALRFALRGTFSEMRVVDRMQFYIATMVQGAGIRWDDTQYRRLFNQADIYHSTLYNVPRDPDIGIANMINVYDMIPMIHPEFFLPGTQESFSAAVNAFSPEDWFIAISQHTKTDLCQIAGVDPNRVIVALPAADSALFHPFNDPAGQRQVLDRLGLPDEPYFLCLNTIEPRKNMRSVIRAFAELVRQGELKGCNLVIVGAEGWKREMALDGQETAAELVGRLFFTGPVDDLDLAPLYSGAVGFVYPSHYEGFGLPVLEAMQCGTPVISSATSSLPEVVGDAGLLVDPADLDALAAAMLRLYSDPDLRSDLSARAVSRAAGFSWERFMDQVMDGYRLALG